MTYLYALDGGERSANNVNYYTPLGVQTGIAITGSPASGYSKNFFCTQGGVRGVSPPGLSLSTLYFSWRLGRNNSDQLQFNNSAGANQVLITCNSDGSITVSNGTTVLGTAPAGTIPALAVVQIAGKIVVSPTAGIVDIRVGGSPNSPAGFPLTGVNTAPAPGNLPITEILQYSSGVYGNDGFFRDVIIHDGTGAAPFNGILPDCGLEVQYPASVVSASLTPNGGSTVSNAASVPPNPTVDFNASSTVGAADVLGLTALPSNVVDVLAVCSFNYAYKTDTGARALQNTLTISGTANVGAEVYLSETPVLNQDAWIINTGSISASAMNAATLEYEVAA